MKKINIKSQTGSVTLYTIIALTVISIILISLYYRTANKQAADLEVSQEIKAVYEKDVNNINEIYDNLVSSPINNMDNNTINNTANNTLNSI